MQWTPDLWRHQNTSRHEKQVSIEAVRDFDAGTKYAKWKVGQQKEMFVRFVYHDRMELAGQSEKIMVDLSDITMVVTQVSETPQ